MSILATSVRSTMSQPFAKSATIAGPAAPDQLEALRSAIKRQISEAGMDKTIAALVGELQAHSVNDAKPAKPDQALALLQERGIVDAIARTVTAPPAQIASAAAAAMVSQFLQPKVKAPSTSGGRCFLHVRLLKGLAFTDYVVRDPLPGEQLQLSLELFGQRLDCKPVPACAEPQFAGECFVEIPRQPQAPIASPQGVGNNGAAAAASGPAGKAGGNSSSAGVATNPSWGPPDPLKLMTLRQPMHFVVTSPTPPPPGELGDSSSPPGTGSSGSSSLLHAHGAGVTRSVVALGLGDWRAVLLRRRPVVVSVQLGTGPGAALGLPAGASKAGVVQLQLALHPQPPSPIDEPLLAMQQRTEVARDAETGSAFVHRAKLWWAEYIKGGKELRTRPIKVLARGEDGVQSPVCAFVRPLVLGRCLPTPRHSARFVALLREREDDVEGGLGPGSEAVLFGQGGGTTGGTGGGSSAGSRETWCTLHTLLSSRSGSSEELAVLLASLLLGHGLDAYVAVGRRKDGSGHMWVVTRGSFAEATFWEPATGQRHYPLEGPAACPYMSVGCLFNHQRVFANLQPDDGAATTSYLLEEPSLWHELRVTPSDIPGAGWCPLPLHPPRMDTYALEAELEAALKHGLEAEFGDKPSQAAAGQQPSSASNGSRDGVEIRWDEDLEHLLMPALHAYEYEAIAGEGAAGNAEFAAAIKSATPLGWIFKGVPQFHRNCSAPWILAALKADKGVRELLGLGASGALYGLRVHVTAYPEGLVAVWLMLAVKYKPK